MTKTTKTRPRQTKLARIREMLSRKTGADLTALQKATGWQAHSVRAALSALRKAGYTIDRLPPKTDKGACAYRIASKPAKT